ncbi:MULTISPECIES: stage III sporulation protein AG [Clostridium]|uniref:Stage III sporulation protein AG n=1 Tax=Clostridium cibarium TaxID=2762247 RepID=A0ABR8PPB2_9CLOT|nr:MULTISPECIES: stage III sporulation protein AG [Clostridium]MBD7910016.1 stage III sporulation protein AG [Clostridium cibarium]
MDKDKIFNELKKILKDKKVSNSLAVLLILAFVLIAINILLPKFITTGTSKNQNEVKTVADETVSGATKNYEEEQKKELINILKKIQGTGNVDCMITFESGEVKVPAYDIDKQNNTTEETDKDGGKRVNKQQNDSSKVVMSSKNGDNEPFILENYKPKVIGVLVVAEGAKNSKVKSDIEKAVENLYGLPANKVNVYTMN